MELLDKNGLTEAEYLAAYRPGDYERPSVTADIAVFRERKQGMELLLIRRGGHPFLGKWALPGGFINMDEDLEAAALRELYEETGVRGAVPVQIGAYGRADRDPRGRIITVAYLLRLPEGAEPKAGDDAADAGMFEISVEPLEHRILLKSAEKGVEFAVPYSIDNGRAVYPGETLLAGDHSQVLADALLLAGIIKAGD